jgi:succinoglycan biosynthesis transport protein ExoP
MQGETMSVRQLIEALLARRWLFLGVAGGMALGIMLISLVWPKTYLAETTVVVDSKTTDPVSGTPISAEMLPSTIATQVDVIVSHNVARKAVDALHLTSDPVWRSRYDKMKHGSDAIDDWIADSVLKKVNANPSHDSHVINIDVGAESPKLAADIANAFADAYIQTSLELTADPARRQSQWFAEQTKGLRSSLELAQSRLSEAQQSSGVVGTNEQIDVENTRLAELSTQLITAQASMYENQNKLKQLNHAVQNDKRDETPELASSPLLQALRSELVRAEANLAETSERFGVQHPQYTSAQAQVAAIRRRLAAETRSASGSISQQAAISAQQTAELQGALAAQRDRVLRLKQSTDKIEILRRDVDSAKQAYDSGLQRANQVHLESQLNQSNIAILNPALPPAYAAKPNVFLNTMVGLVLGCMLGLAAVIAMEGTDQRVRSADSLEVMTGMVLLAEIPTDLSHVDRWWTEVCEKFSRPSSQHQGASL